MGSDPSLPIEARRPSDHDLDRLGVPSELDGRRAVGLSTPSRESSWGGEAVVFYSHEPVDGMMLEDVYAAGGLMLSLAPLEDALTFEDMQSMFPGRIVRVEVGPWPGGLNWADPDPLGNRPFGVLWTDETRGNWLSGLGSAADLLSAARVIAC